MLKLYDADRSGNAYRARLMLSLLGLPFEKVPVDLAKKQQMEPWFLAINPLHQVPVLDDDGVIIRDSSAILVYLAQKYGRGAWYPAGDARSMAEVQQWLSFSTNETFHGNAIARAIKLFGRPGDLAGAQAKARDNLAVVDGHLKGREWLVGKTPTVADVCAYPYLAMSSYGDIDMKPYAHVLAWCKHIEKLPGYVAGPGLPVA